MLTLQGIYGRQMYETWYKMTVLLQSGLDIRPVITHRFSYRDFEEAFRVMRSGNSGKVILNWEELSRVCSRFRAEVYEGRHTPSTPATAIAAITTTVV